MRKLTEKALHAERRSQTLKLAADLAEKIEGILEDASVADTDIATGSGFSETRVGAWWRGDAHVPVWLPALRVVPIGAAMRIVGAILSARAEAEPAQACETATALLVSACGAALSAAGDALADGKVSPDERRALRPIIAALHDRCARWLRQHGGEATARGEA